MLLLLFWRSLSLPPLLRVWLVAPVFVLPALFFPALLSCVSSSLVSTSRDFIALSGVSRGLPRGPVLVVAIGDQGVSD